jgi:hypothetical protein
MINKIIMDRFIATEMKNPMNAGMLSDEFAAYCLTYKKVGEGEPIKHWIKKFPQRVFWVVKRALKELFSKKKELIVNWCAVRKALITHTSPYDATYEKHLFNLQPQRN